MPQIELMGADLPHTLFNRKGKDGVVVDDEAVRLQMEANRKAKERREKQEYTVEEIFAGEADKD